LPNQLGPSRHLSATGQRCRIRDPHFRQEPGRIELRQNAGIDGVGLDFRFGDQMYLQWICYRDPCDMRRKDLRDRRCIAGRFHDDVIIPRQCPGKSRKMIARHADPAKALEFAVFERHRFREDAMNVQADNPHFPSPS
jgi:hypothetical protein